MISVFKACLVGSWITLLAAFAVWFIFYKRSFSSGSFNKSTLITPFRMFLICFFFAVVFVMFPLYYYDELIDDNGFVRGVHAVTMALHRGMRVFLLDAEFEHLRTTLSKLSPQLGKVADTFNIYVSVLFVIAPVFTASFALSFFKNISGFFKLYFHPRSDIYLMSELNEQSIALAEDIVKGRKNSKNGRLVLFSDVFEKDEEENFELVNRAKKIGALCFRKDITALPLKHKKNIRRKIYFIGMDEDENVRQALAMIERCSRDKRYNTADTEFYVFANTVESEMLLNSADNGLMKLRRVCQNRNLALKMLGNTMLYENAKDCGDVKKISAAVIGLGRHGRELLKGLCWLGQMPDYEIEVHVFDYEGDGEEEMSNLAPELISRNGIREEREAYYRIVFHDDTDVNSLKFLEELSKLKDLTSVFVALGEDELNIETAIRVRMQFGRDAMDYGRRLPPIHTIVYDSQKSDTFARNDGLKDINGVDYGISFEGSLKEQYSLDFVEQSELEARGLRCHLQWANTPDKKLSDTLSFGRYEYHRRSSMAEALYEKLLEDLGLDTLDNSVKEVYERRRWNAYMRCEGYVCRPQKNLIAKTHYELCPFGETRQIKAVK